MRNVSFWVGCTLVLGGCVQEFDKDISKDEPSIQQASIPKSFNFETSSEIGLRLSTLNNADAPLLGVPFTISYSINNQEIILGKGITPKNGKINFDVEIPSFVEQIELKTNSLGILQQHTIEVKPGTNTITIGGRQSITDNTTDRIQEQTIKPAISARTKAANWNYLSNYNTMGTPDNLLPEDDIISQSIFDMINASLPEYMPVPVYNPQYLDSELIGDTQLKEEADVWITFVHEGAGYRNALGFYTYDLNNAPQSVDEIDQLTIVFPNVSFKYGGGELISGNKIMLGHFPANTGIGWFLVPDGWNGQEVIEKSGIKYSNRAFNTFTTSEYGQHVVLLKDDAQKLLLLGIEDISRPAGDNDFNDAVFYVTASPYTALFTDNLASTKGGLLDTDNDGVADNEDDYPNDSQRAFNVYAPGQGIVGTLAFEDNWPERGDYDLNDVVIEYNYQFVTNAQNKVKELIGNYTLVATGAYYDNGFGIEFPVLPSQVASSEITGTSSIIHNATAMENGQHQAVFIFFDDAHVAIGAQAQVNTRLDQPKHPVKDFKLQMVFKEPLDISLFSSVPFNPFIFVKGDRTREVHLPDHPPTDLADELLFNTMNDTSNPSEERYYKSETNLPWAIHLPTKFDYPIEYFAINLAHTKFSRWAESGGFTFRDWYQDIRDYRQKDKIYNK